MQPTEADSEIEEEHLLNFVVNSLDEELAIDLGEDVEVTTETLYEVLAGEVTFPRADQRSKTQIHALLERLESSGLVETLANNHDW